jgi:hypothetical protein
VADDGADPPAVAASALAPGDALLRPISLAALALLLLNDHVLKHALPGPVTGKLSDIAGVILLPIFLWSAAELVVMARGRWRGPSQKPVALAALATGAMFAAIKLVPAAALGAGWLLGTAQWSLSIPLRLAAGAALPGIVPATIVVDPTDLLALPCLLIAVRLGRSRVAAR